jgi:hypothetical protein
MKKSHRWYKAKNTLEVAKAGLVLGTDRHWMGGDILDSQLRMNTFARREKSTGKMDGSISA